MSIFLTFITIWMFLIFISTICDHLNIISKNNWFISFSLIDNYGKIVVQQPNKLEPKCSILYGIRVLTSFVIIFIHFLLIIARLSPDVSQLFESLKIYANFLTVAVDNYFLISGLMSSQWFIRKWKITNGKVNIIEYYLSRLLRIIPMHYLSLWFFIITINELLDRRFKDEKLEDICSKNWILNALFVSNLISSDQIVTNHI
jgi:peptidoglycan/LPS O-acetylase OafA/YrhL